MLLQLSRSRPLRFVYAPQFKQSGSTVMRGEQLSAIAGATSLAARGVSYVPVDTGFRRSDLFLTKGVLKTVDTAMFHLWRKQRNRIFVDPVDEDLSEEHAAAADVIVAASRVARDAYVRRWPNYEVRLINHHVDPRVSSAMTTHASVRFTRAEIAYFGELANAVRSPRIARYVDFNSVDTSRQDSNWFDALPRYNLHYAVRQTRALDRYKPFLKGFTAAACRSNVLIYDDGTEATTWLPSDYPFWIKGELSEDAIVTALEHARDSFGSTQWLDGLAVMADIAEQTSPATIGTELVSLFR